MLGSDAREAAKYLLGCRISHDTAEGCVSVQITEVEAYLGEADPASHAYRGMSQRNRVMFGPPGHLYLYLSHGLHVCGNVVTGRATEASAVLLRAGEVVEGRELALRRRGPRALDSKLASGPGNLMRALGVQLLQNGTFLVSDGALRVELTTPLTGLQIQSGPRVGVSRAADSPQRFWKAGNPSVSAYRRSPRTNSPLLPR